MHVLIIESDEQLAEVWKKHLVRQGANVTLALDEQGATRQIEAAHFDILILDILLKNGSALGLADLTFFKQPDAQIIFVTRDTFFSDGSVFNLCSNARAVIQADTPPEDIAAMAEHYTRRRSATS